jgi:transposase, IS30 family
MRGESKYTKLAKLPHKSADSVVQACTRVLLPLADRIETITYDNGKEFASHVEIATSLRSLSYFAQPYHSWERGLNEHTNGLSRQYFPKGSDLSIVSDTDVQRVEDKLNSRPRKILGYRTPREVFFNAKTVLSSSQAPVVHGSSDPSSVKLSYPGHVPAGSTGAH